MLFIKRFAMAVAAVLLTVSTVAADTWTFDKPHSSIGFSVRHLVVSNTKGYFNDYDGEVQFDGKNFDVASVSITISVASIDTKNTDRDDHLRSPDFFDVETYPTIEFKSKKIVKGKGNNFKIIGDLTIKDVTKEVTLDAEFLGVVELPKVTKAGFTAETTINRQDFNVKWDNKLQDGSLVVGNDVKIMLEIELNKEA